MKAVEGGKWPDPGVHEGSTWLADEMDAGRERREGHKDDTAVLAGAAGRTLSPGAELGQTAGRGPRGKAQSSVLNT